MNGRLQNIGYWHWRILCNLLIGQCHSTRQILADIDIWTCIGASLIITVLVRFPTNSEQLIILFYLVKATANSLRFEHDGPLFRNVKDAVLCSGHASLWPPVAHSPTDPTAHNNSGMITSAVLTRFSVPPHLSTFCFKPSRLMIITTLQTLLLPVSQLPLFQHQWTRLTKN